MNGAHEARQDQGALDELLQTIYPPLSDPTVAHEFYRRLMSYELWIQNREDDEDYREGLLPGWHEQVLLRWPEGFAFYRQRAFEYVSRALRLRPWGAVVHGLLMRAVDRDPQGARDLRVLLEGSHDRYMRQRQNANSLLTAAHRAESSQEALRLALQFYQAVYEVDLPLWFLGVIGKALGTGQIDTDYLGGPQTRTQQGSLIEQVTGQLKDTPLSKLLQTCYDRHLRNSIGHNDIEIVTPAQGSGVALVDHATGRSWTSEEAWEFVHASHEMYDAALMALQLFITGGDATVTPDMGVVSMVYAAPEGDLPIMVAYQLWCFRDLAPEGAWLRESKVSVQSFNEGGTEAVSLTDRATVTGVPVSGSPFGESLAKNGWARVVRVAVAPYLALGLPVVEIPVGEALEVVGIPDEFIVPVDFQSSRGTLTQVPS